MAARTKINTIKKKTRVESPDEDLGIKWSWSWRSLAAVVYLIICLSDFLFMPIYREYVYTSMSATQMVRLAMEMEDGAAQIEALKVLREDRTWSPITNDMFHLSFGAILGVSALPMARRRLNKRKRYDTDFGEDDYSGDDYGQDEHGRGDYGRGDYGSSNRYGGDSEHDGGYDGLPTPTGRM